jgi:hypothetical protein
METYPAPIAFINAVTLLYQAAADLPAPRRNDLNRRPSRERTHCKTACRNFDRIPSTFRYAHLRATVDSEESTKGNRSTLRRAVAFRMKKEMGMNITLSVGPLIALIAGILILVVPRLLNFIVALYLIIIGILGLLGTR